MSLKKEEMDFNFFNLVNNAEYNYVWDYVWVAVSVAFTLLLVTKIFYQSTVTLFLKDQVSPYECGFIPYDDARARFEVHFYIVALLFVIFDVEIILLVPWVVNGAYVDDFSLCVVFIFFIILGLGFLYEWLRGALSWFFIIE